MKIKFYLLLLLVLTVSAIAQNLYSPVCGSRIGVNMSGAEYSWEQFPTVSDLNYIKSKGITLVRLPISWEKFQPDLNGPLDINEVNGIKTFLDSAGARGIDVIVDLHNYARYNAVWTQMTAWNLWSNGYIASPLTFPSTGTYTFVIQSKGSVAGGVWPDMEFRVDGVVKGTAVVNSATFTNYTFSISVTAGTHTIAVAFTNDATVGTEDRNLYLAKINITGTSFSEVLGAENMPIITTGGPLDNRGEGGTQDGTQIQIIGSTAVPVAAYQDLWTKLATRLKGNAGLYGYDIMNEPYDMPNSSAWPTAAQAAVNAIRAVDMNTTIYMEGTQWSSAENWIANNNNLNISDPANKLVYEAHQYFDDGSGTYTKTYDQVSATPTSGVTRVQPFLNWLQQHSYKGYLGEFAVPDNDARWLVLLNNVLKTLQSNGVPGTNWEYTFHDAGDPSWYNTHSLLNVNPADNSGNEMPQMGIITKYVNDPCTTTGVKMPDNNSSITIFPNPSTDVINISGITGKTNLKLYDIFGKLVIENETENNTTLHTSQLSKGIYTLATETIAGKAFNKLVISK